MGGVTRMYIYVGRDWHYQPGVGAQRKAETSAARAANGGVDLLTGEGRAAGDGNAPEGLISRLIAVDPDNPDGPGLVLWVWETREQAEACHEWLASDGVRERTAPWMDTARLHSATYEVVYFGHRAVTPDDVAPSTP